MTNKENEQIAEIVDKVGDILKYGKRGEYAWIIKTIERLATDSIKLKRLEAARRQGDFFGG